MRYWVFVNNSVQGPFTIKEIVEKKYISPDLLVCPADMIASKPSSWYFVRELSEFDPYIIDEKSVAVADEDFDLSYILDSFSSKSGFVEDDNSYFEKVIGEEKKKIEERQTTEYKERIFYLEKRIKELDEKLSKAVEMVKEYEKGLKEKDSIIERLEREIESIKKLREEDNKISFEKIRSYEDTLKTKEDEIKSLKKEIEEINQRVDLLKESSRSDRDKQDSLIPFEDKTQDTLKELKPALNIEDNITTVLSFNIEQKFDVKKESEKKDNILEGITKKAEDSKISDTEQGFSDKIKELNDVSANIEMVSDIKTIDKESQGKKLFTVGEKASTFLSDKKEISLLSKENEQNFYNSPREKLVLLKPIEEVQNTFAINESDESNLLDNIDIPVEKFQSEQPIEKETPFQVADVSFEFIETKLDRVESSRIEPIPSSAETLVASQHEIDEKKKDEPEDEKDFSTEGVLKKDVALSQPESKEEDKKTKPFIESKTIIQPQQLNIPTEAEQPISSLEREEIRTSKSKSFITESSTKVKETSIAIREKKGSKLLLISGVGVIIFFFALVYILRNGENTNKLKTQPIAKNIYQTESSSQTSLSNNTKPPPQSNNIEAEKDDEMKISKINENVKNAIDIVKNYNLGEGKGSIEKWLSNTVASSVKGKEEWNATYLSGSIFVVQYRFLRYRAEPVVYLFEVDVDKREIVRGINNNAINLLSSKKSQLKSATAKKVNIDKHIEKDDEMF